MSKYQWALLAATLVAIIYGVTFTIAKDVMPTYVKPYAFISLRVGISTLLFWGLSFWGPKEKIANSDYGIVLACAFFGVAFNMLTFFKGLSYTSPIMGAILMVTTPLIVLTFSTLFLKTPLQLKKTLGIIMGLIGTLLLILYGKSIDNAPMAGWGNFLVFLNAASYAAYLIIVKKLMDRYHAFTFVKWIYTLGFFMVIPFGWNELQEVSWSEIPNSIAIKIAFVVVVSTFLTYLLNLLSMKELKPETVAVFIYLQPLFATIIAVILQKDHLDVVKVSSMLCIFLGVYWVSHRSSNMSTNRLQK